MLVSCSDEHLVDSNPTVARDDVGHGVRDVLRLKCFDGGHLRLHPCAQFLAGVRGEFCRDVPRLDHADAHTIGLKLLTKRLSEPIHAEFCEVVDGGSGVVTADDLVNREFHRLRPNELWVTDITQHRTREGWIYCAAVLDVYSRRIVGCSIDSKQDSTLVVNALDMAIRNRRPEPGGIVHADHGAQFTSWVFGDKIRSAGLLPSSAPSGTVWTTR